MTSQPRRTCASHAMVAAVVFLRLAHGSGAATAEPAAADLAFFENRIRPVLAEHCFSCHGAGKQQAGLRLDSRDGILAGGEHGAALVPGQPDRSRLIEVLRHPHPATQEQKPLGARQVADLVRWVSMAAPWPAAGDNAKATGSVKSSSDLTRQHRAWWAFQPVRRPAPPSSRIKGVNAVDAFVFARLEAMGLAPNPRATPRELIRRVYFDLLGLPPAPEAVADFEKNPSSEAWAQLIEELLARPQYGERWGRHWLDVVRYAQSNGYERDGEKPYAWRYRDYVIRAFNQDKPYDQFVREQIAGDELDPVTLDSLIATGFQRLGVWDDEPDDKRMAEFDELDDILATTGTTFLGLTLGCARCHEHKFDPIPQSDYYQLLAFFRNVSLYEAPRYTLDSPNYVPLANAARVQAWKAGQQVKLTALQEKLQGATNAESKKRLSGELERLKNEKPPFDWALAVRERGVKPPPTHLLIRGNAGSPGVQVEPAFLSVVGGPQPKEFIASSAAPTSGRRRELAEWLTRADHPLTARVLVNRLWQHHFGRGIVKTTSDFGRAGTAPTHPLLLDWLAAEFMAQGWSLKQLHRTILLSATYQMSARAEQPKAAASDPGNDLFWRQNLRRLEAESLRDTILAISGQLQLQMGGRGFFPRLSAEVLAGQSRPGLDWERSTPAELARRSLYAYVRRTMPVPVLEAFDYNNTATPLSERPVTTVAPQALLLLNDEFMRTQAAAFARRLTRETSGHSEQLIDRGFQRALGRSPSRSERRIARDFLADQERAFTAIGRRRAFSVEVPAALSVDYMDRLQPADFLAGPREGWSYHRGTWSSAYEGIRAVDRARGPFALAAHVPFVNGVLSATLLLPDAVESAGLLLRAQEVNGELHGYELHLDPRRQRIALLRHGKQTVRLEEAPQVLPADPPVAIRIEAAGPRFRVWLGDLQRPAFEVEDPAPLLSAGRVGLRMWGASVSVAALEVEADGRTLDLLAGPMTSPRHQALEAFCLLLLNLNEVVYVD